MSSDNKIAEIKCEECNDTKYCLICKGKGGFFSEKLPFPLKCPCKNGKCRKCNDNPNEPDIIY